MSRPAPKETAANGLQTSLHLPARVISHRNGAVLARGMVLKTDHYPMGRAKDLEMNVGCSGRIEPV